MVGKEGDGLKSGWRLYGVGWGWWLEMAGDGVGWVGEGDGDWWGTCGTEKLKIKWFISLCRYDKPVGLTKPLQFFDRVDCQYLPFGFWMGQLQFFHSEMKKLKMNKNSRTVLLFSIWMSWTDLKRLRYWVKGSTNKISIEENPLEILMHK